MEWTLITGGARKLGAEICIKLAEEGLPILIHYHTSHEEALNVKKACHDKGVAAEIVQGDLSSIQSLQKFIELCRSEYPSIGNLINNIGGYLVKPSNQTSLEEWMSIFQTNLHVPFALSQAFYPSLCQNKGNVINLGVVGLGCVRADVNRTAYMSAKTALWLLTKSLAREWAASQVRVNMVSPGYLENAVDLPNDLSRFPMNRPATLAEVARVVAFLLQENNQYITGQNIEVGGGVNL